MRNPLIELFYPMKNPQEEIRELKKKIDILERECIRQFKEMLRLKRALRTKEAVEKIEEEYRNDSR